jgi:hypothetical protein
LKQLLTSAPILKIADPNEYFMVFTDACKEGLGGVLSHEWVCDMFHVQKIERA